MSLLKNVALASLIASVAQNVQAGPTYTITRLGTGYSLSEDAGGHIVGIRGTGSDRLYTFDKVPVTQIPWSNSRVIDAATQDMHFDDLTNGTSTIGHMTVHVMASMSNNFNSLSDVSDVGGFEVPTFRGIPVLDFNTRGDVAGVNGNGGGSDSLFYEGFWHEVPGVFLKTVRAADGKVSHDVKISLDNYTRQIPGFGAFDEFLRAALMIDDHGRILVDSLDHNLRAQYYLFKPGFLDDPAAGDVQPAPVPEPCTLALFTAVGVAALASKRRKSR